MGGEKPTLQKLIRGGSIFRPRPPPPTVRPKGSHNTLPPIHESVVEGRPDADPPPLTAGQGLRSLSPLEIEIVAEEMKNVGLKASEEQAVRAHISSLTVTQEVVMDIHYVGPQSKNRLSSNNYAKAATLLEAWEVTRGTWEKIGLEKALCCGELFPHRVTQSAIPIPVGIIWDVIKVGTEDGEESGHLKGRMDGHFEAGERWAVPSKRMKACKCQLRLQRGAGQHVLKGGEQPQRWCVKDVVILPVVRDALDRMVKIEEEMKWVMRPKLSDQRTHLSKLKKRGWPGDNTEGALGKEKCGQEPLAAGRSHNEKPISFKSGRLLGREERRERSGDEGRRNVKAGDGSP
ncbi:hypothetical protein C8J57DRAFT_1243287 [Mycena rebaudengoi]|nr:hypothetical protein C8J57DRAFT_1243287 [Mycena rebaudengoi]